MNIISIDFSKFKTGVFQIVDGIEKSYIIKNKYNVTQEEALKNIYSEFISILNKEKFDLGLIEGYGFNPKNKKSMIPMCEISGVVRLAFSQKDISLITIPIQTWKSLTIKVTGKERKLEAYLNMVHGKYGKRFNSSDEADAYMIYQAAKIIAKKVSRLNKAQKKIRDQIKTVIETNGKVV